MLHETSLPPDRIVAALLGFNGGVELGQLTVIALAMAATYWLRNRTWYFKFVTAPASLLIACIGLFWTIERVITAG